MPVTELYEWRRRLATRCMIRKGVRRGGRPSRRRFTAGLKCATTRKEMQFRGVSLRGLRTEFDCRSAACEESLASVSANRGVASVFERSEFASSNV